MSEEKLKVKYKIRHITDYTHKGEPRLDNASHQYVAIVESLKEINDIMKDELKNGWNFLHRRDIADWGSELFFENEANKKTKPKPPQKSKL